MGIATASGGTADHKKIAQEAEDSPSTELLGNDGVAGFLFCSNTISVEIDDPVDHVVGVRPLLVVDFQDREQNLFTLDYSPQGLRKLCRTLLHLYRGGTRRDRQAEESPPKSREHTDATTSG